ncbi:MAG TPA: 2-oxoglutarate and iron-dependent oxygenase domain-containing protein [Actinomycetota bacterium]|nr:2-oxoglutarate and iron-dependent oxygenase domain-containing protein [Actinomycetota bacterium]
MDMPHATGDEQERLPVVDVGPLADQTGGQPEVAARLAHACRRCGFFYVTGHGVDEGLQRRLEQLSRAFFAQEESAKLEIRLALGGRALRGYFPVGAELTSGRPDRKEGIYFGTELCPDDPRVLAGTPLHGSNLFPAGSPELRDTVLAYMAAMTRLGHTLMAGIAQSLGLEASYFADRYTADPLTLFRIFNYPPDPSPAGQEESWGVGEHTDYGLLTILKQDDSGGLEVRSGGRWIAAPPVAGSFVCNIGDMLDRMTGGRYRSTPHRVRNQARHDRLSFPFFFDPSFDARVEPIPRDSSSPAGDGSGAPTVADQRWDRASVHEFQGTYGDYVLGKVARVFPELGIGATP